MHRKQHSVRNDAVVLDYFELGFQGRDVAASFLTKKVEQTFRYLLPGDFDEVRHRLSTCRDDRHC